MITEALQHMGLSDKEAQVYLTCLELGQSLVSSIARKANVQRELTYSILHRLEQKGFVHYVIKNGKKYYEAVDARTLIKNVEEKKSLLTQALPEFTSLTKKSATHKPVVHTFEGSEGIKTIFNKILLYYQTHKTDKTLLGYGSAGNFEKILRWSLPHFINKRVKEHIHFKVLYNKTKEALKKKSLPLSQVKFLPETVEAPSFYLLYPDHIAIFIFSEEPVGIIIESQEVYQSYKNYFQLLWNIAK